MKKHLIPIVILLAGIAQTCYAQQSSYTITQDCKVYQVDKFTDVGSHTWTRPSFVDSVDVLIVAGGGGGGTDARGGGGGAGELGFFTLGLDSQTYSLTVGDGGAPETAGEDSEFDTIKVLGGGRGGNDGNSVADLSGGSGGGGTGRSGGGSATDPGGNAIGLYFGNPGGQGQEGGASSSSGGGGGAGEPGENGIGAGNGSAGKGGDGLYFGDKFGDDIGDNGWFAGGGGGSREGSSGGLGGGAEGGLGGGGTGDFAQNLGSSGMPNTGGGGGGVERDDGHAGGSGIVLVRYEVPVDTISFSGGSNWNVPASWGGNVPNDTTRAVIPAGENVTLSSVAEVYQLVVESGASLTITGSGQLTVYCSIENNGTITVENNGAVIQRGSDDNNTGNGTYTIKRVGQSSNTVFNAWSSPVPGIAVHNDALVGPDAVFSDANPCDIFVFDASQQNWSHDFEEDYSTNCDGNSVTFSSNFLISGADGILTTARGYFVPGATPATRTFEGGSIHNGDVSVNLQGGSPPGSANWTQNDWNFIGNPYPSAIRSEDFLGANSPGAVYIWTGSEFDAFNTTSGNTDIGSAQGFFVQGTSSITFTNAMRTGGSNSFRSSNNSSGNEITRMWLTASTSSLQSEVLIGLPAGATRGFDLGYDAPKYYGQNELNITAQLPGGEDMAIYAESPLTGLNEERKIPLTLQTANTDEMKFAINRSDQMPENLEVFLVDEVAGIETNLLKEEHYSFTPDTAGNYRDRFYLKLVNKLTAAEDPTEDYSDITGVEENREEIEVKAWARQNDIVVESRGVQLQSVELIDVSGRTLAIQRATSTNRILMETSGLSSGVYMVRSLDTNGVIRVNKVMLGR